MMQSARASVYAIKLLKQGGQLPQICLCRSSHGGHHAPFGPTVTFDYMPVPSKPYGLVYKQLQRKFNIFLGASIVFFFFSIGVLIYSDAFPAGQLGIPQSYRDQKKAGK